LTHAEYECMLADQSREQWEEVFRLQEEELERIDREAEERYLEFQKEREAQEQEIYEQQLYDSLQNEENDDDDWDLDDGTWTTLELEPRNEEEYLKSLPPKQREPFRMDNETKAIVISVIVSLVLGFGGIAFMLFLAFVFLIGPWLLLL